MVTGKLAVIQANTLQNRLLLRDDSGLFPDFAFGRIKNRLAPFHPAAGQKPARPIGMPDQQNPVFPVKNRRSRAQRESPRLPVERLQDSL